MTFNKQSIIALVTQLAAFAVGFGVLNSATQGIVIAGATAILNLAFLIAGAIHSHGLSLKSLATISHSVSGSISHGFNGSVSHSAPSVSVTHSGVVDTHPLASADATPAAPPAAT